MKKAPQGAPHHNLSILGGYKAPEQGTRVRGGTRISLLPLKIRPFPENLPTPAQSEAGTTESEALGVDTVHTLFFDQFDAPSSAATHAGAGPGCRAPSFQPLSPCAGGMAGSP